MGKIKRWVRQVYEFAINPNISFYFGVPVDVASERILAGRPKLKYYEAGVDRFVGIFSQIYMTKLIP
jgi:thymidylate kinase